MKRILLAFALLLAVAGGAAVVSSAHADEGGIGGRGGTSCPTPGC